MSVFKMPEPGVHGLHAFTETQLRQAVIDALEMAATRCEKFGKTLDYDDGGNYAEEIRALKEQIK